MSENLMTFITENIETIAQTVGFDTEDIANDNILNAFVEAGIEDMLRAGVSENVIINNKLSLITLCLYVKDNMPLDAGRATTSPIYIANVQKLKLTSLTEPEEAGD